MGGLVTFFHVPTTNNEVTFHMLSLDFHVSFVYVYVHMHVCVCVGYNRSIFGIFCNYSSFYFKKILFLKNLCV